MEIYMLKSSYLIYEQFLKPQDGANLSSTCHIQVASKRSWRSRRTESLFWEKNVYQPINFISDLY